MDMSLLAASDNQPVDFAPVRSRTAVVDSLEDAPHEEGAHAKSIFPSLLTSVSCSARNSAIKGAEKFTKLVKGNGSSTDIEEKLVKKYEFKTRGICRELSLAHAEGVWHIKVDSEEVVSKTHSNSPLKNFHTSVDFFVPMALDNSGDCESFAAKMTMEWIPRSAKWQYTLVVNDLMVLPCWSKTKGFVEGYEVPEVAPETQRDRPEVAPETQHGIPEAAPETQRGTPAVAPETQRGKLSL